MSTILKLHESYTRMNNTTMIKRKEIDYTIIWKNLNGIASKEEGNDLKEWLNSSRKNRKFYKSLQENYFNEGVEISAKEMKTAWRNIEKKTQGRIIKFRWVQYAAAILIPFIAFFAVLKYSNTDEISTDQSMLIQPGQSKALLTLHDGSVIEINKSDTLLNVLASSTNIAIDSTGVRYSNSQIKSSGEVRYNTLETQRGEEFSLALADGTHIWLNAETKIRYPEVFNKGYRELSLVHGEVFLDVSHDEERAFYVNTDQNRIKVLGTQFNVRAYPDELSKAITLLEGSVALQGSAENVMLKPDEQAVIDQKSGEVKINKVDANIYAAWTRGKFVFKDVQLSKILSDLERWYNIDVFYQNPSLKSKHFSLYINRYRSVNDLLEVLEATNKVKFEIHEDNIIVKGVY